MQAKTVPRSNRYAHIGSKVKKYIEEIKKQEAERKRREHLQLQEAFDSASKSEKNGLNEHRKKEESETDSFEYYNSDESSTKFENFFQFDEEFYPENSPERNKVAIESLNVEPCECWNSRHKNKRKVEINVSTSDTSSSSKQSSVTLKNSFSLETETTSYQKLPSSMLNKLQVHQNYLFSISIDYKRIQIGAKVRSAISSLIVNYVKVYSPTKIFSITNKTQTLNDVKKERQTTKEQRIKKFKNKKTQTYKVDEEIILLDTIIQCVQQLKIRTDILEKYIRKHVKKIG